MPVEPIDHDPVVFRARLDRTIAGDSSALGELFAQQGNLVYRTALRLTGSTADAEDVTQELFVRLPAALGGFTGGVATFAAWIRRVAVRQSLMHLRRGRRRREVSVDGIGSMRWLPSRSAIPPPQRPTSYSGPRRPRQDPER